MLGGAGGLVDNRYSAHRGGTKWDFEPVRGLDCNFSSLIFPFGMCLPVSTGVTGRSRV